ncbi:MAG: hypothetical protein Q9188_004730 [Gyalolechia gomerana]|nr:MAG: hypothetical protein LQ343_005463 [Gyalolechia ehrenbergii]
MSAMLCINSVLFSCERRNARKTIITKLLRDLEEKPRTKSATGMGAQPCVVSKTPYPVRKYTSPQPRQTANSRPTGLPIPAVRSTAWTAVLKNGKNGNKLEAAKQATKPAAPALKSALKSSSKGKTEKKVCFAAFDEVVSINEHAVWSRPEPALLIKEPAKLVNEAFGLDLTKFMDT